MNNTGHIVSRDIFEHKIKLINATADRLGLTNIEAECFDAGILDNDSIDKFDYVLADVPCSGLGIIRRKPEIKYKEKADLKELPSIQSKILKNASKYVKVGGILVYSTCTIQDVENIDIVKNFLKENDHFELVPIDAVNVDVDNQDKGYLKIYPHIHGMDGFFIAKLIRVR
jgi:16S rRNA (cytosine967-C5)-methyltransferase